MWEALGPIPRTRRGGEGAKNKKKKKRKGKQSEGITLWAKSIKIML
jgi:hypothetical protein